MTDDIVPVPQPALAPIPLDAIAAWLERHPHIAAVVITEEIEVWGE